MAEAANKALLIKLAPIIEKQVRQEVCLLIKSTDEAKKLASKLQNIQKFLMDADRRGVTDPRVKSWLDKLQEISYEMDDVLDEWEWDHMKIQLEDNPWVKVSSFLLSVCLCFRNAFDRRTINLKIKQLNERLDQVDKENEEEFKFLPNLGPDNSQVFTRIETTSFVNVSQVIGRDVEKEKLVSKLLSESSSSSRQTENDISIISTVGAGGLSETESSSSQTKNDIPIISTVGARELSESSSSQTKNDIPIISIVGAGGIGKTTLAQFVFNDERIKEHFQEKIWVCVSNPFDQIKVATAILKSLDKNFPNLSQWDLLLQFIARNVFGKSFLLVLDDVWMEDDARWKPLREALKHGAPNSRILVTTRNTRVALVMGSTSMQIQSLNALSEEDCWKVLSQIAFRERTEQECHILNDIGLEIVKKCKGLPLAATTIGSLLRFKSKVEQWQEVLTSPWWEIEKVQKDVFAPLSLSYDELDPVAKRCFCYCAIFPKDTILIPCTLIRMWCAQGFLSPIIKTSGDDMEQKGWEIFDELALRSFFQDLEKDHMGNHIGWCKMHDIVHDFAQFMSKNECLIVENVDGGATSAYVSSARHLNLQVDKDNVNINSILKDNEKCRTFLAAEYDNNPLDLFRHLKRVRVLILKQCFLEIIPSGIESLIHSRYLDLSWSGIKELPEAICDLYNLETLILNNCENLSAFPEGIQKLRKLRHIFNESTKNMEFPKGIQELTNLRTLREIHISSRTNWKSLEFLRNLNKLADSIKISIEGLDDGDSHRHHLLLEAARKAELNNKMFIERLQLCYSGKVPIEVMEALQPPPELEELLFEGPCLPNWLTTVNFRRLTITITEGVLADHLPALANLSPSIEYLTLFPIRGMKIPNCQEFYRFPNLRVLFFMVGQELEEWEDISEEEENNDHLSFFPSLRNLIFLDCPKLKALPHGLLRRSPCLEHLIVGACTKLKEIYEDWERVAQIHRISHIRASIIGG